MNFPEYGIKERLFRMLIEIHILSEYQVKEVSTVIVKVVLQENGEL